MDKLLVILVLVAAGCVGGDGSIDLYSDAAIDAGFEAGAETDGSAEDEPGVLITGIGSGGSAGGDGGMIAVTDSGVADGGIVDGGPEAPTFSVADPDFIEGVWQMTRQAFPYECDGVTIDEGSNPAALEPQIYDVRFDTDHRMYGCGDLTCLLWDPGWFVGDVWHPDEKPSSQQTWRHIEIVAVDENTLTGRAMLGEGGCSGENHFSLDLSRL